MAKNFTLPTSEQLMNVCRELKLNAAQARELGDVIRHVHADLEGYYRTRIGRADRIRRLKQLKTFRSALTKLVSTMGKTPERIADFNESLPFQLRESIGLMASAELIRTVAGRQVRETGADHVRRSAGLTHGSAIFHHQLLKVSVLVPI